MCENTGEWQSFLNKRYSLFLAYPESWLVVICSQISGSPKWPLTISPTSCPQWELVLMGPSWLCLPSQPTVKPLPWACPSIRASLFSFLPVERPIFSTPRVQKQKHNKTKQNPVTNFFSNLEKVVFHYSLQWRRKKSVKSLDLNENILWRHNRISNNWQFKHTWNTSPRKLQTACQPLPTGLNGN